ncbi:MAG TPA: hypothetical protein VFN95_09655, partial [Flavitalea sp.]|nr:hypothetical protein [Flavitalea sp.]
FLMHIADDASGDTWITLAGDREAVTGNSFISLALLQKTLTANAGGTFTSLAPNSTGGRTLGDVQISAEFTGGGSNPNLYLEEWQLVGGVYQWVAIPVPANSAFGSTNAAALTGIPYDAFNGTSDSINSFIEVTINISAIYRTTATPCVGSIASMFVMTKSSQAVNADLTDFVAPIQVDLDVNVGAPTAPGATYCVGQPISNLVATGDAGATFKWYSDANLSTLVFTGASFATGVSNASPSVNNYWVTQSLKGCESQATAVTLTVNGNPTANAGTAPAAQCLLQNGNTFSLSGSGTNGTPSWAVQTNANNLSVQITNGNTYSPSVSVSGGSGTVTLRLTVTSGFTPSCGTQTSDVSVTVNPNPTANAGAAPAAQCEQQNGNTFSLDGSGTNGTPSWAVQTNANNLSVQITNGNTYTPSVLVSGGTGSVTLRLTVASNATPSCGNATNDVTVTVNPNPTANAGATPGAQCFQQNGNTFNLSGSGSNGTPSWAVQSNPGNLNVQITNGNTYSPSVLISGNTAGGSVTLRLTVTSNASPSCGTATNDVTLTVNAQVAGPSVTYIPPTCTEKTFKVRVNSPVQGTTYTIDQPDNNVVYPSITFDGVIVTEVVFTNLVVGDGFSVTAESGGCTSSPSDCGSSSTDCSNGSNSISSLNSPNTNNITLGPGATSQAQSMTTIMSQIQSQTKVSAAPNPFNDRVRFVLESAVSGQGSLELYNTLGQKVHTVYQGYVEAGKVLIKEFTVPRSQRGTLIYVFRVGNQRTTGKLIGIK